MLAKSFIRFVAIFGKKMALLVHKLWGKLSKSVFGYFKTTQEKKKKLPTAIKLGGGKEGGGG